MLANLFVRDFAQSLNKNIYFPGPEAPTHMVFNLPMDYVSLPRISAAWDCYISAGRFPKPSGRNFPANTVRWSLSFFLFGKTYSMQSCCKLLYC